MDLTAPEKWAKDVIAAIEQKTHQRPAKHVVSRLALLMHDCPVEYVDAYFESGQNTLTGRIAVFTERAVGIIDVRDVRSMHHFAGVQDEGTVAVRVVPRAALERIDMTPATGTAHNSNRVWTFEGQLGEWPWYGQLSLTYRGLPEPLLVPRGQEDGFAQFAPKLARDLAD